ncbi:MAG TPA: hypothetical protein DCS93_20535 [Microscillaceae bacterium]|nr:hypothetical protein [Microscillaceae bacterium]
MHNKTWNSDKIVSASAILISLMTLFVSLYQTAMIRKQQRLSVLPYLSLGNYNTGGPNYKLVLKNDGIGPAFIESVEIVYKGKKYPYDLPVFMSKSMPDSIKKIKRMSHSNIYEGQMIPAGTTIPLLAIHNSREDADKLVILLRSLKKEGLQLHIIYRSVYEERWRLSFDSTIPEKL